MFTGISAICLTKTVLPSHALLGEDVILECLYDMEGDKLYSVKWYRNGKEFYRHIPTDIPPTGFFPQLGLQIDVSRKLFKDHFFLVFAAKINHLHWHCRSISRQQQELFSKELRSKREVTFSVRSQERLLCFRLPKVAIPLE